MARKKVDIWMILLVGLVVFMLFRIVRENYDQNYPGASMDLVEATVDSSNNLTITVMYTFTPPVDPKINPPPRVAAPLSSLQVVAGNQIIDLVPSQAKSVPPTSPIKTQYSASIPTSVDRNSITQANASGYLTFTDGGSTTYGTTPTFSSSAGIKLI